MKWIVFYITERTVLGKPIYEISQPLRIETTEDRANKWVNYLQKDASKGVTYYAAEI